MKHSQWAARVGADHESRCGRPPAFEPAAYQRSRCTAPAIDPDAGRRRSGKRSAASGFRLPDKCRGAPPGLAHRLHGARDGYDMVIWSVAGKRKLRWREPLPGMVRQFRSSVRVGQDVACPGAMG